MAALVSNVRTTFEMIKIEHTLFALPFAFLGAVLAANGLPSVRQALWITVAMVWRAFYGDGFQPNCRSRYDARNPRLQIARCRRTFVRRLCVGIYLISATLFFVAAARLNRLTLMLAPVALASVLLYSFSKRWTLLSHLLLGWCLSIAPTGAWIAVRGALDSPVPLLLSLVVMFWTAGFDVLYACQDYDFDVRAGLHSIPRRFGIARSLLIARLFHVAAFAALLVYTGLRILASSRWSVSLQPPYCFFINTGW